MRIWASVENAMIFDLCLPIFASVIFSSHSQPNTGAEAFGAAGTERNESVSRT